MSDFRIEDLFEPLDDPDQPQPPTSLDEMVEQYGFDELYASLHRFIDEQEQR